MTTNRCAHHDDQNHAESPSAHLLQELQLYGCDPWRTNPIRGRCLTLIV